MVIEQQGTTYRNSEEVTVTKRKRTGQQASFATPAKGLIVRSAEGRRLGSLRAIPTNERKRDAIAALTKKPAR
jgi:hypothetical protein